MTKFITNQNIEIKLELAGLGDRILAYLIDGLIMTVYAFVMALLGAMIGGDFYLVIIILLLPLLFYSLFFEIYTNGQSPGKKSRNIKVVKLDGGSPGLSNYLLRWVLKPIDVFFYGSFAILSIIITKNGQRLGDLAAGTTVIKERASIKLADVRSLAPAKSHEITFPQVKRLNDKQAELIKRALHMRRDGLNDDAVKEVASKTKEYLQIETDLPHLKFLYTVLKDYEYIHYN